MKINKIDHVGIIVEDLEAAKGFFLELGLKVVGEQEVEGEWVGKIIALENVKDKIVMMQTPDGEANIELVKFYNPVDDKGIQPSFSNTLGIRHICFDVQDVEGITAKLRQKGFELMGEIYNYENVYKLCYIRGPEGIILELAEKLG
ncbi:MAG: VOC family protein [Patescibacteria group bacterium]